MLAGRAGVWDQQWSSAWLCKAPRDIWTEQCEATRSIRARFGLKAAFDYLVSEKLLNFADAAYRHPEFAKELPGFVSQVRCIFSADEIRDHLARIERETGERDQPSLDDDEVLSESPTEREKRILRFKTISELLTTTTFGTS